MRRKEEYYSFGFDDKKKRKKKLHVFGSNIQDNEIHCVLKVFSCILCFDQLLGHLQ